jgi:hypothetical protein
MRCDIYVRYFQRKEPMENIAADLGITRVTVSRVIHAWQARLTMIRPDLGSGRPQKGIHYARYAKDLFLAPTGPVLTYHTRQATAQAETYISDWWTGQKRESKDKRWMDADKLHQRYKASLPAGEKPVSYKTFTRLMKRIIGDAFTLARGRPIKTARRKNQT